MGECHDSINSKSFGGFFPLQVTRSEPFHPNAHELATACAALRIFLRSISSPPAIWMPTLLCPEVELAIGVERPSLLIRRYSLDGFLRPLPFRPNDGDIFYHLNLFGLSPTPPTLPGCTVIVDNVHAFFSPPVLGCTTLYSARKFFGVPDGAYLYTDQAVSVPPPLLSHDRCLHLLKSLELGSEAAYSDFLFAEKRLVSETPAGMSRVARALLQGIDYKSVRQRRGANFMALHNELASSNALSKLIEGALASSDFVPFSYPYLCDRGASLRRALIQAKVFVPLLWPEVISRPEVTRFEHALALNTVHLPVDQRYTTVHMNEILCRVRSIS